MLELWEILVPVKDWYDIPFTLEHHRKWDNMVCSLCGGLNLQKTINGKWFNKPGFNEAVFVEEQMIPVRIACDKEQLEQIIEFTIKHYSQEAVMAYKISDEVIIQEKPKVC